MPVASLNSNVRNRLDPEMNRLRPLGLGCLALARVTWDREGGARKGGRYLHLFTDTYAPFLPSHTLLSIYPMIRFFEILIFVSQAICSVFLNT